MMSSRALLAAAFLLAPAAGARADVAAPLASHRAVYELSLDKATGSKAPAQARGRIVFDFSVSCDGFVQNFRQITELTPAEGATKLSDMRSATFEALDSASYRFNVETRIDNASAEDVDGKARKESARVAVDLTRPKRARLDLDGPLLFPTEHLRRIIDAARAGESILEARVYDGTGQGDRAFDTMALIGKATSPASEKAAQIDVLRDMKRWRASVSYLEPGKRDGQPIYVLSFDLYENGISRALKLDYGDFTLKGEMSELTIQPAAACKK
jgi:hypothetical protein